MREVAVGRSSRATLRWVVAIAVLGLCVAFLARRIDRAALAAALAGADYRLVLLMAAGHFALFIGIKAWRWRTVLAPIRRLPIARLYRYCLAGCAVTNVVPARAGLAVRVLLLRRDGVPVAGAVGSLLLEEICNAAILGLICLPLPLLLHLPPRVRATLAVVTAGGAIALLCLVWLARAGRARARGLVRRVSDGVAVLGRLRAAGFVFALTAAMWVVDLGQIALAMKAVAVQPSYTAVALVLLFVNLSNAFPATPGQMGLFEAGATAACVVTGATPAQGVAVGVLYHMMQFIPETIVGLLVLGRGALDRAPLREQVEVAPER